MKQLYQLLICIVGLFSGQAYASYKVTVNAPSSVSSLIKENLDLVRYSDRDDFSTEQVIFLVQTTAKQVATLLATEGYFSPETQVKREKDGDKSHFIVTVTPGEQTKITTANIAIQGPITKDDPAFATQLNNEWALKPGTPFRQEEWSKQKDLVLQKLQDYRFPAAKIQSSRALIQKQENKADLSVDYDSGPSFTLGGLSITGLSRYPKSIIENVNPLVEGEVYSSANLQSLQRQVLNTNYFSNVVVNVDTQTDQPENTPVKVHVTELPTQRIRTGIGYSTNTGTQLEGRYTHYNVFNKAWVFDTQAKVEKKQQLYALNLSTPPNSDAYVHTIGLSKQHTVLEGADLTSIKMGVERTRSSDNYDTTFSLTQYQDELIPENGSSAIPTNTVVPVGKHKALVPGFKWSRRRVDNPIFPRDGHIFSTELDAAVKGALTDQTFGRVYFRYKEYFPVFKQDMIIWRSDLGGVFTDGKATGVPASLLFRAGGTDTVRGYSYQSIGNTQNGTVYPTKYLAVTSLEYQHWFSESWGAATFYDVGTAADSWAHKKFYQGTGVGARWRSPVGTLQFDLAYGIQAHRIRPHISLGIAF